MQETVVGPILERDTGPRNLERARSTSEGTGVEYGRNRNSGRNLGSCETTFFGRDLRKSHLAQPLIAGGFRSLNSVRGQKCVSWNSSSEKRIALARGVTHVPKRVYRPHPTWTSS